MATISSLARKLAGVLGPDVERHLEQLLHQLEGRVPELVPRVVRVLEAANALLDRYTRLHGVQMDLSGDAFSDWHLSSGRIESGRRWKTLLDYSEDELPDSIVAWRGLAHLEDLRSFDAAVSGHAQGKSPTFQATCRLQTKGGGWRWLLLKGRVVAHNERGEPARLLLLQRDISEFKQAEEAALVAKESAEAANRARGTFLANMSHEIRTPMNGIIGMTELALDTQLDAEQRHYLKTVKSSAEALLGIVNDILDFSKIEAGKLRFEEVSFSLSDLVFDVARAQAVMAHRKGLELIVSVARQVPARVVGDPARVRQVLTNLVGNAVKFTEHGEIEMAVSVDERSGESVMLRFVVRDTGIGIPAARQTAIFDAFSQGDDSTTRRFGGTGLGLSICSHLVQMMRGRLWLESREGHGSSFYFTTRVGVDRVTVNDLPAPRFAGRRALVIVQHPTVATQLAEQLEDYGIEPSRIDDTSAALQALKKSRAIGFPYDYVLIDALMAAPAGLTLAESWASGACPEKLIILLTAEQQREELHRLRAIEVGTLLVKPVAPEDLLEALKLVSGVSGEFAPLLAPFSFETQAETTEEARSSEVLLVEDNPVNQELAKRLLEKRGYRVTIANNGAEAVECFEQKAFDLILMDMQMPVMGGIEATEAIRAREMRRSWVFSEQFQSVCIIAMTANAMDSDRERCLRAGMNDYVAKPISAQELYAAIDRGLAAIGEAATTALLNEVRLSTTSLDLRAAASDLGDNELLLTMARMLLGEWEQHLKGIDHSLRGRDASQLAMGAHTLKSLLAMFHAERSRRYALDIERAAKATAVDWPLCTQLCDLLSKEMRVLKPEMERFVRGEIAL